MDINRQTVFFAGQPVSVTQIAARVGCSVSHVSLVLSGKRAPSMRIAKKMATAIGMRLDRFTDNLPTV